MNCAATVELQSVTKSVECTCMIDASNKMTRNRRYIVAVPNKQTTPHRLSTAFCYSSAKNLPWNRSVFHSQVGASQQ